MIRALVLVACLASTPALAQASRTTAAPASVPSLQLTTAVSSQPDLCIGVESAAYGSPVLGVTFNLIHSDKTCSRIRRAKALQQLGLTEAGIQLMCDDREVRAAMQRAGTPCEGQRSK